MDEDDQKEKYYTALLRQCSAIVYNEVRYSKDGFRKLFQSKVRPSVFREDHNEVLNTDLTVYLCFILLTSHDTFFIVTFFIVTI